MSKRYPHENLETARKRLERSNAEYELADSITEEMVRLMPDVTRVMGEYDLADHVSIMTDIFGSEEPAENYHEYDIEAAPVCLCLTLWHSVERLAALIQATMEAMVIGDWTRADTHLPLRDKLLSRNDLGLRSREHYLAMAQDIWTARCLLKGEQPPDFESIELPPSIDMPTIRIQVD